MPIAINQSTEWLETDGLGGFASGTTSGIRTRRYHALLLAASTPPTGRFVLVNGVDARVCTPEGQFELFGQRYAPDVTTGSANVIIESFSRVPWPRWVLGLADGTRIQHELFIPHGSASTVMTWRLLDGRPGVRLCVRPLISGRDYHDLHHENADARFEAEHAGHSIRWSPYREVPGITAIHNGEYRHEPVWYRRFQYDQERDRGFDHTEDLASPGILSFDLGAGEAAIVLSADTPGSRAIPLGMPLEMPLESLRKAEAHRREQLGDGLARAADAYIVRRDRGATILAGYPWFADWGRDTCMSVRGLCLATGRIDDAGQILARWASAISDGMLPNRFPDGSGEPEYNSVDASLWFVIAAHEYLDLVTNSGSRASTSLLRKLRRGILDIVGAYTDGTRYGIGMTTDGLLAAGEPGVQLTWMDARVGSRVVTPRIGKPVEVQALWINALWVAAGLDARWKATYQLAFRSFQDAFWNPATECLFDVVDADHVVGRNDPTLRPNQILAVGGLPLCLLDNRRARRVVDRVEARLLTPMGLSSLASDEQGFCPQYLGGPEQRDGAYHQGTVWPWLMGPFVEAWVRVRGDRAGLHQEARERFLMPLIRHLDEAGLCHISEVADAQFPHRPDGCPFQAWSLAELIRLDRVVLADAHNQAPRPEAFPADPITPPDLAVVTSTSAGAGRSSRATA